MDLATQRLMQVAAGAGGDKVFVDDVFSTHLWRGTGSARSINTGIDMTEGGLTWIRRRNQATDHYLFDTVSGATKYLASNDSMAQQTDNATLTAFNNNGFSLGTNGGVNGNGNDFVGWTFRKAPGFFDIVTWTGDNDTNRAISHSLGSSPGMIIVKNTSNTFDWAVWHRSIWNTSTYKSLQLNTTGGQNGWNSFWGVSAPTSSHFYVRSNGANVSGQTYVAYVFAHDDQQYGNAGNTSVIKCGSYTGNGNSSTPPEINLGWEPQWVMVKRSNGSGDWVMVDSMRGMFSGLSQTPHLRANSTNAEQDTSYYRIDISSGTGFAPFTTDNGLNGNGDNYVYMAIRRSDGYVGKPPELGTDVFALDGSGAGTPGPSFVSNFPVDFGLTRKTGASQDWYTGARVLGSKYLKTNSDGDANTDAEMAWDFSNGFVSGNFFGNSANQGWMWKRHAGFDVVAYTGTGSNRTIAHSMGVAPTMMWVKRRNSARYWGVYHSGLGDNRFLLRLNENSDYTNDQAAWNNTAPTSTVFSVGTSTTTNASGSDYIAILFASITGISAVGSYSGSGSTGNAQNIGFQPRFLFIKRTNSTGDWMQFNSVGGFGNYMQLNTTQQQYSQTYVNVSSTGFSLVSDYGDTNESGSSYIYYAHA